MTDPAWNLTWRRAALLALGNRCAICLASDWRILQIDHVNGGGNRYRKIDSGRVKFYKLVISEAKSGRFQALCANCNQRKRYEQDENRKVV